MYLDVAVCLPQEAETVGLVRTVVRQALRMFGVTGDCIDDICLALSEACTNVVQHAVADDDYEVQLQVNERDCAIRVKNVGNGFDAAALANVMPEPSSPRGRGVAIMRALMDRVDFRSEPEAGTMVLLVKTLTIDADGLLARLRQRPRRPQTGVGEATGSSA